VPGPSRLWHIVVPLLRPSKLSSPAMGLPVNSCQHPRTLLHQHTAW
jgi:hypothetical protein